ncbi:hypothetical protein D3C87_2012270 [compost metagenome]
MQHAIFTPPALMTSSFGHGQEERSPIFLEDSRAAPHVGMRRSVQFDSAADLKLESFFSTC